MKLDFKDLQFSSVTNSIRQDRPILNNIAEPIKCFKLSDVAECKIGIVTGANEYLLQSRSWLAKKSISSNYYYPILSKSNELAGIQLRKSDILAKACEDHVLFLMDFEKMYRYNRKLYYRIKRIIPKSVLNNATFKYRTKKKKWFIYDDKSIPDLFLSYHTALGPRAVINTARLNTTNSLHRLYLKRGFKSLKMKKLISISLLTSLSRNSADEKGRRYGSGILKLEPGDAKNVLVPIPTSYSEKALNDAFTKIDDCLRNNNLKKAIELADQFVFNRKS